MLDLAASLFERHPLAHIIIDETGALCANEAARRLLSIEGADDVWGSLRSGLATDPDTTRWIGDAHNAAVARHDLRRVDGQRLEARGYRTTDASPLVVWTFDDVTEAQRREQSRAMFESIFELIPDMIFVKDAASLEFLLLNPTSMRVFGVERHADYIGKTDFDFFPTEEAEFFRAVDQEIVAGDNARRDVVEPILDTSQSTRRWLNTRKFVVKDGDGQPRFLVGIATDITERTEAQEALRQANEHLEERVEQRTAAYLQANEHLVSEVRARRLTEQRLRDAEDDLRKAQRLEALGRLAGGVAHDFNNLLTAVLWSTEYIRRLVETHANDDLTEPVCSEVAEIEKAAGRAADLTQKLLAFSRQQVMQTSPLMLRDVLNDMQSILERLVGDTCQVHFDFADIEDQIDVDSTQLAQVVTNLAVNARDAMPDGGAIRITTQRGVRTGLKAFDNSELGEHLVLSVSDEGSGIDDATAANLYEPFFTTKEHGKGTGLGLATVYGIVSQSGGLIELQSELGVGTTFSVLLPVATERPDAPVFLTRSESGRATETILIVDDEAIMRRGVTRFLEEEGYTVLCATNAQEARALAADHPFDLLLTDVSMPGSSGLELSEHLRSEGIMSPIVLMSGLVGRSELSSEQTRNFLQKPFQRRELLKTIRAALDEQHATARVL